VICHNDVAPYNMVFVDERPRALIDFDTAGPGPRIWDLAYAAYTFVPLASFVPRSDGSTVPYASSQHAGERARRLRLLAAAYGMPTDDLLATVERRLDAVCQLLMARADAGDEAYRRLVAEGHLDHYRREVAFVRRHASEWRPPAG
jgi:Ser/Thr protein kinase RdoA (MazF antagonist)